MMLRVAKCRFGPLRERYTAGGYVEVDRTAEIELTANTTAEAKRGVLAGLDRSHSRDYKVNYVSDPLLVVHGDTDTTHRELKEQLEDLGLWKDEFIPIHRPRTGPNNQPVWAAGFKSLPRSASQLDQFKQIINNADPEFSFESDTDIEAAFPDRQQTRETFSQDTEGKHTA